jgi:hypothetical protein
MSNHTMDDINNYLFGGGGKAAEFKQVGDMVVGTITNVEMAQQTTLEDNKPLFWEDGTPRMQLIVTLQTDLKDDDEDDGIRRLYAKGGKFEVADGRGQGLKEAIADALKKAGLKRIELGQKLTVGYTGNGKTKTRGHNAPKLYSAKIEAGTPSVDASALWDE